MLRQKNLKIGSLKTPFSALSGRNMWQNGTENWRRFSSYFYLKKWLYSPNKLKYDGQIIEIEIG